MKRIYTLMFDEPGDKGAGGGDQGGKTGDEGKTPEQIAAEKKAADDAAAKAKENEGKTPEQIAADEKKAAEEAERKRQTETGPKAPEKYELKLPDGSTATAEDVKAFEGWARSLNLTNEQAQAAIEQQHALVEQRLTEFKEETAADADYGGEKLAETQRLANLVLDKVRPKGHARRDALLGILTDSGYINNIEVVSFLADLGRMAGEDTGGGGRGGATKEVRAEDQLFPTTAAKS